VLFVNQQVSPADDFITSVVKDFYLKLKAGDTLKGRFRVGSNQAGDRGADGRGARLADGD
jgi:hypothetical protein